MGASFKGRVKKVMGLDLTPQMVELSRQRLDDASDSRGAFSRFRRVLGDYPELRNQWHARQDAADARAGTGMAGGVGD